MTADTWLIARKAILLDKIAQREEPASLPWQEELAAKTGASAGFIAKLAAAYNDAPFDSPDADAWLRWLLLQLDPSSEETDAFLRPEAVGRVFGRAYTTQKTVEVSRRVAIAGTLLGLIPWFSGKPLCDIEIIVAAFVAANEVGAKRATTTDSKRKRARRFSIRLAPDLGFLCGVFSQVAQKVCKERGVPVPPMPGFLSQLTRHGYRTPYHFALSRDLEGGSRVDVSEAFEAIAEKLDRKADDDWNTIRQKLERVQ